MTTPPQPQPNVQPAANPAPIKQGVVPIYVQPPFDHRLTWTLPYPFLNTSGTGTNNIRRGFLEWDTTVPQPTGYDNKDPNYPAVVNFLFNPSTISTSYQIANGQAQAAMMYGATQGLDTSLLLPLQQQASFTLMFDRTFELNDPTSSTLMKNFGVDMDIAALRQYTGMYAGIYSQNGGSNASYFSPSSSDVQQSSGQVNRSNPNQVNAWTGPTGNLSQGIMQVTLGYVYFSGPTSTEVSGQGYGIAYYGYIDSWSVEYTHFTVNMIPLRAVVDISFTFLPPPTTAPNLAGAAKLSAAQQVVASAISVAGAVAANIPGIAGR